MINLFGVAIAKDELLKFALGRDEYFIADRDYGDHSVIISWTSHILPLIELKGLHYVNKQIENMFCILLNSNLDETVKNESLLYHLHVYYYLDSECRIKAEKLSSLNQKIFGSLDKYLTSLKAKNDPKENAVKNAINLIRSRGGLILDLI